MLIANKLLPAGRGLAPALIKRAPTIELDWDLRQKSRFESTDSSGRTIGIFLPRGSVVRGGDVLVAEDGSLVRVIAAPQAVLVITHCTQHGTPFDLTRAAYHLGNRHVPIELRPDRLQIEPDHVLAEMLRSMHLIVHETQAPFEPEAGAYGAHSAHNAHGAHGAHGHSHEHPHGDSHGDSQGHGHHHDRAHDHTHTHEAGHTHSHPPTEVKVPHHDHGHAHGPGCKHDH